MSEMIKTIEEARASDRATLTLSEVATLLDLDPRTVSEAAKRGELPARHVGRRVLFPRAPFLSWLMSEKVAGAAL